MAVTYTSRVQAAARWLDNTKPGWAYLVNMSKLDLDDPDRCICGQVFAAEGRASDPWPISGYSIAMDMDGFGDHDGVFIDFVPARSDSDEAWDRSTQRSHELWKNEIRKRRGRSGTRALARRAVTA